MILIIAVMVTANAADVYVNDTAAPGWYDATHVKTIQEGINNATSGQSVYVYNGSYNENIFVNKSLTIQGENKNTTIINCTVGCAVRINMSNVSFSNFTVTNASSTEDISGHGIYVYNETAIPRNVTILNCVIYNNENTGIYLYASNSSITNCNLHGHSTGIRLAENYCNISNCDVSDNTEIGFYILSSLYTTVTNCSVHDNVCNGFGIESSDNCIITNCSAYNNLGENHYGFRVDYSSNITWRNNTIYDNFFEIFISGGNNVYYFYQDIDTSNTVREKPMYYFVNQNDAVLLNETHDAGFIGLVSCDNVSVSGSNVSLVVLAFTTNSTIDNVTIYRGAECGLYSDYSSNNCIANCNIIVDESVAYGINMELSYLNNILNNNIVGAIGLADVGGNNNTIYENNISNCLYGVYLSSTSDDLVYGNNFVGNTVLQAYDELGTHNIWNRTYDDYPVCGNHWDNYTGVDNFGGPLQDQPGSDDIGDTSIGIPDGSRDYYPLMDENEWWQEHPVTSLRITARKNVPDVVGIADSVASVVGVILIILSIMSIITIVSRFE